MKNWKTSLMGIIVGCMPIIDGIVNAYSSGVFTGKSGMELIAGIGMVIYGLVSKDHNVTGGTTLQN